MVFIVECYPYGWIRCECVDEDECVEYYLANEFHPSHMTNYILGWDLFIQYIWCLNGRNIFHLTKSGYFYRNWNNSAWVVIEADNAFDAVEKAETILKEPVDINGMRNYISERFRT